MKLAYMGVAEEASTRKIQVIVQDIESGKELCKEWILRGKLAKLFRESKVMGARDGFFIIQR